MDSFNRSVKRLFTRLVILALIVVCGAIAIAQAQRGGAPIGSGTPDLEHPAIENSLDSDQASSHSPAVQGIRDTDDQWSSSQDHGDASPRSTSSGRAGGLRQPQVQYVSHEEPASTAQGSPSRFSSQEDVGSLDSPVAADGGRFEAPDLLDQQEVPDESPVTVRSGSTYGGPGRSRFAPSAALSTAADIGDRAAEETEATEPPPYEETDDRASNEAKFGGSFAATGDSTTSSSTQESELASEPNYLDDPTEGTAEEAQPSPSFPSDSSFGGTDSRGQNGIQNPIRQRQLNNTSPQNGFDRRGLGRRGGTPVGSPSFVGQDPSRELADQTVEELPGGAAVVDRNYDANRSNLSLAGDGRPGPVELEGAQTPSISIRKVAPTTVSVGQSASFQVLIRNVGPVTVEGVTVRDELPQGTEFVDATPQVSSTTADGGLLWQVGSLRPGEERTISFQVNPQVEGVIGSVATVTFQSRASARASATKPALEVTHTLNGSDQVMVGENVSFTIQLTNPGTGPATKVILKEDVPEGLQHSRGPQLEYEVGTIPPGGSRRLELSLKADKAGHIINRVQAEGDGGLRATHQVELDVVAPDLRLKIDGPTRHYVESNVTFAVAVENPGTADARNVELQTHLPSGLVFVSANNNGRYDQSTNSIRWSLEKLPAGQYGTVKFTASTKQLGEFHVRANATAAHDLRAEEQMTMLVDGIAALSVELVDRVDPIAVGGQTVYEIRVKNQGTKGADNVRLAALLPVGMKYISGEGRSTVRVDGQKLLWEPISQLPPKGEFVYQVQVEGVEAGDQRFKVQVQMAGQGQQDSSPVVEEESTHVFSDR